MKKLLSLTIALLLVPMLVGCPGNSSQDRQVQQKLWEWIQLQDANGWVISGYENATGAYKNIILDHKFKPTRLELAIKGDEVNNLHQRNMLEDIARQWRNYYPANMYPRFTMKVEFFNKTFDKAAELGYTEINKDGIVDTHQSATQDVM